MIFALFLFCAFERLDPSPCEPHITIRSNAINLCWQIYPIQLTVYFISIFGELTVVLHFSIYWNQEKKPRLFLDTCNIEYTDGLLSQPGILPVHSSFSEMGLLEENWQVIPARLLLSSLLF